MGRGAHSQLVWGAAIGMQLRVCFLGQQLQGACWQKMLLRVPPFDNFVRHSAHIS